jgi:hypothetical protein
MSRKSPFSRLFSALTQALVALWELREQCFVRCESPGGHAVTKQDLEESTANIMGSISNFAAAQEAVNAQIAAAITGVASDIAGLNALIQQLQDSAGTVSPEDQALLDALQVQGAALAARLEALDAETPPPVVGE